MVGAAAGGWGLWGARGKVMGRRMKGHIQTPEKRQGEAPKETRTFKTAVSVGEVELSAHKSPETRHPQKVCKSTEPLRQVE